jgi:NAD+ diphosphatase
MNGQNVFAGAFVDRWGHRREDPDWLKKALERDDSCFLPVWGDKCLATGEPFHTMLLDRHKVRDYLQGQEIIFLGKFRDKPAFAFGLEATGEAPLCPRTGLVAPHAKILRFLRLEHPSRVRR